MSKKKSIGVVGGRGYVGQELLPILARHRHLEVAFVASTQAKQSAGAVPGFPDLRYEDLDAESVASRGADAVILALGNGQAERYAHAIDWVRPGTVIVDVSADHRFDDGWTYGLPELGRDALRRTRRVANPGCYATAAALAVKPLVANVLVDAPVEAFGVSGYSGAGATPSPRNDVEQLRDNLMPYALVEHTHEREVTRHAGPVHLMPHVAPFFRGITLTVSASFIDPMSAADLERVYTKAYEAEPLVRVTKEIPRVRDAVGKPHATIGGFAVGGTAKCHGVLVVTLDNLLKGAASQAVQNLNLALGFPELEGILP